MPRHLVLAASLVSAVSWLGTSAAQDSPPEVEAPLVMARVIEKPPPRYPISAAAAGVEGWVVVSYIVATDGSIIEPIIEDSSGFRAFENATLNMLDEWKYEPATRNGEPVEQSVTKTKIIFRLEGIEQGARRAFIFKFREISDLIASGDYASGGEMLEELRDDEGRNVYEDAWFRWLEYGYLDATGSGDTADAEQALRRAVGYEDDYLDPDNLVAAIERLFAIQVTTFDLSAAINTFERLRESKTAPRSEHYEVVSEQLQNAVDAIARLVDGPKILEVTGRIGENEYWAHELLRRSFSIAEIDGEVDAVEIRCDSDTVRYESVIAGSKWTVPGSWGECSVYVKGVEGTTLKFYEHPEA